MHKELIEQKFSTGKLVSYLNFGNEPLARLLQRDGEYFIYYNIKDSYFVFIDCTLGDAQEAIAHPKVKDFILDRLNEDKVFILKLEETNETEVIELSVFEKLVGKLEYLIPAELTW
jgi:hypothetical protein